MKKKYCVTLEEAERLELQQMIRRGKGEARIRMHAQVLLKADAAEGGPAWDDGRIAEAVGCGRATVERVRRRFIEQGLEGALQVYRKGGRKYRTKLDGAQEAHLIALACSKPPEGQSRWTLRLLAGHLVELKYVDSVCHETVRQTLKKTNLNHI